MIEVNGLTKDFGSLSVLKGVNACISKSEVISHYWSLGLWEKHFFYVA